MIGIGGIQMQTTTSNSINNNENFLEKIELIKKINTDDSNFILKVYEAYINNQKKIKMQKENSSIVLKNEFTDLQNNIIDLDKLYTKPYFYTKMRIKLEGIIEQISYIDKLEILQDPLKYCNKIIFNTVSKNFDKPEQEIDIAEFIKSLDNKKKENQIKDFNFTFVAKDINEETLFKEEQLKKAIEIIKINDISKRNERIYEEIYNYMKKDFVANQYCDFQNDRCIAQRNHARYPLNKRDGCCFTRIRTCPHLNNGNCEIECLPCRLYSCPYLSKRGVLYYANEFVLLKAFYTKKQRKPLIFDFYHAKQKILNKIDKKTIN